MRRSVISFHPSPITCPTHIPTFRCLFKRDLSTSVNSGKMRSGHFFSSGASSSSTSFTAAALLAHRREVAVVDGVEEIGDRRVKGEARARTGARCRMGDARRDEREGRARAARRMADIAFCGEWVEGVAGA